MKEVNYLQNQAILAAARRKVIAQGGLYLKELVLYRINPLDPMYPIAYRPFDKQTKMQLKLDGWVSRTGEESGFAFPISQFAGGFLSKWQTSPRRS